MVHSVTQKEIPVRLITIPVSHYCEKARWALRISKIPFLEERHMPPFHRFATRRTRKQAGSISETERNMSSVNRFVSRLIGGQSVPLLITETSILTESDAILKWVDEVSSDQAKIYPSDFNERQQVEEIVKICDSVLAPAVRQWFYFHVFNQAQLVQPLWCQGVPGFESLLFPLVFRWMSYNVFQMYAINDESASAAYRSICNTFQVVENLLSDGRTYLVGEQFSAADLAFATLAAPVVMPRGYGVVFPDLSQLPSQMPIKVQEFRETQAGKFVLRLYEEYQPML